MRNFHDCSARDGAQRLLALTGRLTMLRSRDESDPMALLYDIAECILLGQLMGAYMKHHALCRALAQSPARRVSGSLFVDYLIWLAVENEHPFALSSAKGLLDEAELMLFQNDLDVLGELASLDSSDIARMCIQRDRELRNHSRYAKDDISVMSTAAWGGTEPKLKRGNDMPLPGDLMAPPQPPAEAEWLTWDYGEREVRGEYASDEVLEEMYLRLMEAPSWKSMAKDLFNMFASSGTGIFLKGRVLVQKEGAGLECDKGIFDALQLTCQAEARQALSERIIDFMRGGKSTPVLLYGADSMGKATLVRSMAEEFPELRLVYACPASCAEADTLLERLGNQPLRFMLFIENAEDEAWHHMLMRSLGARAPRNVLVAASAKSSAGSDDFPEKIGFNRLDLDAFVRTAAEFVLEYMPYAKADEAWLRNAAVDYQLDAQRELNIAAAELIASRYVEAHE